MDMMLWQLVLIYRVHGSDYRGNWSNGKVFQAYRVANEYSYMNVIMAISSC